MTEGRKISGTRIEKVNGGYRKKNDFASHYKTILSFARNRKKLKAIPTKVFPKITTANLRVNIEFPSQAQNAKQITMDDIDSFSKAKGQSTTKVDHLLEEQVKEGFKKILGEEGEFIDHGGEKSDLFSTKAVFNGKRISLAIAFKGRGTPGKLVPGKMGKNGDQIIRLFSEPAELFLVVHVNQIDPSILAQMQAHAVGLAMGGNEIYYGIIDGNDLGRLVSVYPNAFC